MHSIDIESFADRLTSNETVYLLDVRNESDHKEWTVTGLSVHILNIPFHELTERIKEIPEYFSSDKPFFVICYNGSLARQTVSLLQEKGFSNAQVVEGGINKWGEYLKPVKISDLSNGGAIYQFIRFGKGCLSYMVVSANEALVVDPARTIEPYVSFAKQKGWTIKAVADTHLHTDHISGGRKLAHQTGAGYWFPCQDGAGIRFHFNRLEDGLRIPVGKGKEAIFSFATPGHTVGSMSLLVDDTYLLCGDCLFIESVGKPDSKGKTDEWSRSLRTTLFEELTQLPDKLTVLPAHFSNLRELDSKGRVQATLKNIYSSNRFLKLETEEAFLKAMNEDLTDFPARYQDIRRINIGLHEISMEKQQEIESGPTRCAVQELQPD